MSLLNAIFIFFCLDSSLLELQLLLYVSNVLRRRTGGMEVKFYVVYTSVNFTLFLYERT